MKFEPHGYQREAIRFLVARRSAALFADPGLGKTAIILATFCALRVFYPSLKMLVIAPLRPMRSTWPPEIEQWDQFSHLRCQILHGKTKEINPDNDVYVVNPEGIERALEQFRKIRPRCLVVDESSKFKNWTAKRTKILKRHAKHFDFRYIMTGTPAPNSLLDIFSQQYLIDDGEAFGRSIVRFKEKYFHPIDWNRYKWEINPGAKEAIEDRIAPWCLRLDGDELLELPEMHVTSIRVDLQPKARAVYRDVEKQLFAELDGGDVVSPVSSAASYGACRQIAGGEVYLEEDPTEGPRNSKEIHSAKVDALLDLLDELGGKPAIVAYSYRHELKRLQSALRSRFVGVPYIGGGVSASDGDRIVREWNDDKIPVLLVHPASVSHGLNLQYGSGRHIVWYSLTDDPEAYEQTNRRIMRQGVTSTVFIYHLIANGTVDEMVLKRLQTKSERQSSLLDALRAYREGKQ